MPGQLRLGCTVEFIDREDCLPLLEEQVRHRFPGREAAWTPAMRYTAIENDEVDVVDAFATDALLSKLGLTMLEDDRELLPALLTPVNFVRHAEVLDV